MTSRVVRATYARLVPDDVELARRLPADALSLLLRAAEYAQNACCSVWEFAVQLVELRRSGLRDCDLRWLACKGYLEYALEANGRAGPVRTLAPARFAQFNDRSYFVLTLRGAMLARRLLGDGDPASTHHRPQQDAILLDIATENTPIWDRQRRELRIGRVLIKRFCVPAENQEIILSAFEEEAWPAHIDDPLPPAAEIDPKRRLHSAIQCLNRNQKARLLHFHGDGYGRGIRWERQSA